MKGQEGLMEYIILTFFIVVVVIVLIFFLFGYQVTQFSLEKKEGSLGRALSLAKQVSASGIFSREDSILDDAKLTSLQTLGNACKELERLFGKGWFLEVTAFGEGDVVVPCTQSSYPNCNYWSFCSRGSNAVSFDLPVNIYRNPAAGISRTDIGLLKVGVYVE